jgi:hypothetical protein
MPTWFNKWETKKRKLKNIKPPPHTLVLDPTQKKQKGGGILGRGLKKEKKKQGQLSGGLTLRVSPTVQPPRHHFPNEHCGLTLLGKPHVCSVKVYILQADCKNKLQNAHYKHAFCCQNTKDDGECQDISKEKLTKPRFRC